jgi:hypothetical protein
MYASVALKYFTVFQNPFCEFGLKFHKRKERRKKLKTKRFVMKQSKPSIQTKGNFY